MSITFTFCWSMNAASSDPTGLWGLGALLILFGMALGTIVVTAATAGIRSHRQARRNASE